MTVPGNDLSARAKRMFVREDEEYTRLGKATRPKTKGRTGFWILIAHVGEEIFFTASFSRSSVSLN